MFWLGVGHSVVLSRSSLTVRKYAGQMNAFIPIVNFSQSFPKTKSNIIFLFTLDNDFVCAFL